MYKTLEHREHAEHLAHAAEHEAGHDGGGQGGGGPGGHAAEAAQAKSNQMAALLVAVLAAGLAITEQGAKHAEIRVQENSIFATDAWAQYQAKSTRGTFSKDLADLVGVLGTADPELMARRRKLLDGLSQDQERFEKDPKDGKAAIAVRAHGFEEERDHSLEQTHAYHNGAAAMELGIVLSTASAIIKARLLLVMAAGIGVCGIVFAVLGYVAPALGAL